MADRDQLRQKFASLRQRRGPGESVGRRADYKGERARLNLRVPEEMMALLSLLRVVDGGEINTFCVSTLDTALRERLTSVRRNYSDAEWDVLVRCARGGNSPVPSGGSDGGVGGAD